MAQILAQFPIKFVGIEGKTRCLSDRHAVFTVRAESRVLEARELVAHARGLLEFEVACVLEHLLFEPLDLAREVFFGQRLGLRACERLLRELLGRARRFSL